MLLQASLKMPLSANSKQDLTQKIKTHARKLGFNLVGITPAQISKKDIEYFKWWLAQGFGADMQYLYKNIHKRENPAEILQGAKSIICCAVNYYTSPSSLTPGSNEREYGIVSNYAHGDDYHKILLKKLKALSAFIKKDLGILSNTKEYVDTGALLERSYAASAGLGWIGKNTCLINKEMGSYIFLGEILTDLELLYDKPVTDHCGTCTACLDACPTQALPKEGVLDANKCISYLTIEYREENLPQDLSHKIGQHLVGCDICQEVCPWNNKAPETKEAAFYPREDFSFPNLNKWKNISEKEFSRYFQSSPIKRLKWKGLMRNIKNALESTFSEDPRNKNPTKDV